MENLSKTAGSCDWQRVDDIFHGAVMCSSHQRWHFVDAACAGDPGLRREVEELLEADAAARDFLDEPVGRAPSSVEEDLDATPAADPLAPGLGLPREIGGVIRLDRLIGRGGMGEVYVGRHEKLDRTVAVKCLRHDRRDPEMRARLLREARLLSQLDHPNVCRVYDFIEDDDGVFLVLERIAGRTLREVMGASLDEEGVLALAEQVAGALSAAHRRGIVHRDLKPDNVMLTPEGVVKVLDFGVARIAELGSVESRRQDPSSAASSWETGHGFILGTPRYMSPEQARGKPATEASDMFSFGIFLRELLAATGGRRHAAAENLVLRLTSPSPASRPTAAGTAHELRRLRERPRRRAGLVSAAVVLVLATLGSAVWRLGHEVHASDTVPALTAPAASAESPPVVAKSYIVLGDLTNETGERALDETLALALRVGLEQSRRVRVLPRERVRASLERMRHAAEARIDRRLGMEIARREGARALVLASIFRVGSGYRLVGDVIDPATGATLMSHSAAAKDHSELFAALDRISREIRSELGDSLVEIAASQPLAEVTTPHLEALEAYSLALRDGLHAHDEEGDQVISLLERALEVDPEFAMAHAKLGVIYFNRGQIEQARRHFTSAMTDAGRLSEFERTYIEGWLAFADGDEKAIFETWSLAAKLHPERVEPHVNLAVSYLFFGERYERALESYQRAMPLLASGERRVISQMVFNCHLALEQYDEAAALLPALEDPAAEFLYHFAQGRQAEALASLSELPRSRSDLLRAVVALDRGRAGEALALVPSEALALVPSEAGGKDEYGRKNYHGAVSVRVAAFAVARRHEELSAAAEEALERAFASIDDWGYLFAPYSFIAAVGKDLALAGEVAAARSALERMRAVVEPTGTSYWIDAVEALEGDILLAEGEIDAALDRFHRALATSTASIQVRDSLVSAYETRGDYAAAIAQNEWILAHRGLVAARGQMSVFPHDLLAWNRALKRRIRLLESADESQRRRY